MARGPFIGRKLTTVAKIGEELGRIYRGMRQHTIDSLEGWRMASVLMMKAKLIQDEAMQAKLGTGELVVQVMRYSSSPELTNTQGATGAYVAPPILVEAVDIETPDGDVEDVQTRKPMLQ